LGTPNQSANPLSSEMNSAQTALQPPLRDVWFQLVDAKGDHYMHASVDMVELPSGAVIANFCDAVQDDYAHGHLYGIASSSLLVYENKTAFSVENALQMDSLLDGRGAIQDDALIVVVPPFVDIPVAPSFPSNY
jgi:hypothetical protein